MSYEEFKETMITLFKRIIMFSGRASRREITMVMIYGVIILTVVGMIFGNISFIGSIIAFVVVGDDEKFTHDLEKYYAYIYYFVYAVLASPSVSLTARRLHDCNRSGWWQLIMFVPGANIALFLYCMFQPGTDGPNDFGDAPAA